MSDDPGPTTVVSPTLAGFDAEDAVASITTALRDQVWQTLSRRGVVVAMSGGVDSSVCAALAVRALGAASVFGLMLPDADSEPESLTTATAWADELGIAYVVEDITRVLDAVGCYRLRDTAVRQLVPEYGDGWRCKIVTARGVRGLGGLSIFDLVVESPKGESVSVRLDPSVYREIVAATNFKQRVRTMLEYYHADRLHYAVLGTPNRLEYDQGFFVKGGDGLADVKPIAHLYKGQVYELAEVLGVPREVIRRSPTTDTYPLAQSQEEFYFPLPLHVLDDVLWARNAGMDAETSSRELELPLENVNGVFAEIDRKRRATRYLHLPPLLSGDVPEVEHRREGDS